MASTNRRPTTANRRPTTPNRRPTTPNRGQAELARQQAETRRKERRTLAVLALAVVVVLVAGGIGFQAWRTGRTPEAESGAGAGAGFAAVTIADGQPIVLGQPDAAVEIAIYEDFHCPACIDFAEEYHDVLTDLQSRGVAAVAVYPLAFHDPGSAPAANAMACAAEAGFGQAYYDGLFANATLQWSDQQLIALAAEVRGAVPAPFEPCVTGRTHAGWVDSISAAAQAAGVDRTPTVFVDGQPVDLATLTPVGLSEQVEAAAR